MLKISVPKLRVEPSSHESALNVHNETRIVDWSDAESSGARISRVFLVQEPSEDYEQRQVRIWALGPWQRLVLLFVVTAHRIFQYQFGLLRGQVHAVHFCV